MEVEVWEVVVDEVVVEVVVLVAVVLVMMTREFCQDPIGVLVVVDVEAVATTTLGGLVAEVEFVIFEVLFFRTPLSSFILFRIATTSLT